jgi:prolyl 4-hydroxylase
VIAYDVLQERARAGDKRALAELGGRLLVGREAPYAPAQALQLIEHAAAADDPDGLRLMSIITALGINRPADMNAALKFVARAAEKGDARAAGQLALLGEPSKFDARTWFKSPAQQSQFDEPRISTIKGFLSKPVCDWIIGLAAPSLRAARVYDTDTDEGKYNEFRSNTGMGLSFIDTDLIVQVVHMRIASAIATPVMHQEPTNVLHYAPGQEYRAHYDFIEPNAVGQADELRIAGQRVATFLIYLNDDYDGGETNFLHLNWGFKGKAGDALIFWNVSKTGAPERKSLHAGSPVTRGEKWLFSKWVRDRPQPLI